MTVLSSLLSVLAQRPLQAAEVAGAMDELLSPAADDIFKGSFLRAWATRGETAEELAFCADALLPHALDPSLRGARNGKALLDCCGTGGGGLNLLNVSTGLMFILAAMDIPVVKHGNRGLTKKSGSADVLEALGIRIDLPPERAAQCLDEVGCAFLFAPKYHPAFSVINPVRRQLAEQGQRTVFNLLGPLLNPARPEARLVGVFTEEHVPLYQKALTEMGCSRFTIAFGRDAASGLALGEISASGQTTVASTSPSLQREIQAASRLADEKIESLLVSDAATSAKRLLDLLSGDEKGMGKSLLLINAAAAAVTHGTSPALEHGLALATDVLESGKALERLERWRAFAPITK